MQHVVSQLITKKEELQGELKYCKKRMVIYISTVNFTCLFGIGV